MIPYLHRYFANDLIKNEKKSPLLTYEDSNGDSRDSVL